MYSRLLLLMGCLLPCLAIGQLEASNWFIGRNIGLSFKSGTPQQIILPEASSQICLVITILLGA
jgi:hypothetical protein